jgi:hypothetical protein
MYTTMFAHIQLSLLYGVSQYRELPLVTKINNIKYVLKHKRI